MVEKEASFGRGDVLMSEEPMAAEVKDEDLQSAADQLSRDLGEPTQTERETAGIEDSLKELLDSYSAPEDSPSPTLDLSNPDLADSQARIEDYESSFQDAVRTVRAERIAESADRDLAKAVSFVKERAGFPDGVTEDHVRQLLMTEAHNNPGLVDAFEKRVADPKPLKNALSRVADKFRAEIVDPLLRVDQSVTADKQAVRQAMIGLPPPGKRPQQQKTWEEVKAWVKKNPQEWYEKKRKAGIN